MIIDTTNEKIQLILDVLSRLDNLDIGQRAYIQSYDDRTCSLEDIHKNCRVCAHGALFLSYLNLYNGVTLDNLKANRRPLYSVRFLDVSGRYLETYLIKFFSKKQLVLIEVAFECIDCNNYALEFVLEKEEINSAIEFGIQYDEDDDRLRAILMNMLENNGEFCP